MSVHGVDYYPDEPRLGVHYELLDMARVDRIDGEAARAGAIEPHGRVGHPRLADRRTIRSARSTTCSACVFDGHPDLRRILMPEDYEGHPQRRDFPVGGEPVLFTHNDASSARGGRGEHQERLPPDGGLDHALPARRADREPARRRDDRAADAQHRPAPPCDSRRAAAARHARRRDRPGRQADHRLRPHRDREDRGAEGLLEGDPGRRAHGLPRPTTSTRWRSAARSRRCSSARCPSAPSTCA